MGEGPTKWGLVGKMVWAFQAGCIGQGEGECLEHCKPSVVGETEASWAGRGRFTFFSSPASWEGQRFIGLQSTGSWVLWTSLWALAVTTMSKTRYCDHGSQGEGRALGS